MTLLTFVLRLRIFLSPFLPSCHSLCLYHVTLFIFPVPHKAPASMCFPSLASFHPTPGTVALVHFWNKGLLLSPRHRHWLFFLCEKLCARVSLGWQFTGMLLRECSRHTLFWAVPKVCTTSLLVAFWHCHSATIYFFLFICLFVLIYVSSTGI